MLSNLDTAWRYPLALLLGLLTGLYIGGMLATIYVITAFRESLDTLSPIGPWFLRYAWADLAADLSARARRGKAVNLDPAALLMDMLLKLDETAGSLALR